jgi:hypothetical protein
VNNLAVVSSEIASDQWPRTPHQNLITLTDCLNYVDAHADAVNDANYHLLAGGILAIYSGVVWAAKNDRKSRDEMKSLLAAAFREPRNPNSKAGKSKRYEFAKLCTEMAQHRDMRRLAAAAAQKQSVEAAAHFLASEFSQVARSVAALARHFGTERQSGKHRSPMEQTKQPFLYWLQARVRQAENDNETIPLVQSVQVLLPATAQSQLPDLLRQLLPRVSEEALPEFVELANQMIKQRRAQHI